MTERRAPTSDEHERRRAEGLATLLAASKHLAATLDLATLLQATTDGVTQLAGLDTAAIYLVEGEAVRLRATTPPLPEGFPEELRTASLADHPHLREAIRARSLQVIPDLAAVPLTDAERSITEQRRLRSVLYLPLVADVRCVGALIVGSVGTPREVAEPELGLCSTLANLAALAVENALLYEESRRRAAELEGALAAQQRAEAERLELERQMLHAQKLESLGVLAGGIAHDFNNLLTAILGHLDLALRRLPAGAAARADIERSLRASRFAADLVGRLLAYSGRGSLSFEPVDLSRLVLDHSRLFESGSNRAVPISLRVDGSLPLIEADSGQVQQVIMNLVINASEAVGDRPGAITVTTGVEERDPTWLERNRIQETPTAKVFAFVEVRDTGCGMDHETQRRLFDPFFSTKAAGRGLGMAAILGIVRAHRGAILVDSAVGRGSAIRVLFPALEGSPRPAVEQARASARSTPALPGGAVLVVDDDDAVREVCRAMLEELGIEAVTAADGREAVALFERQHDRISHVILDLSMPDMNGLAVFEELSRIEPGASVILSSGYQEPDPARAASGPVPAGFIHKPYTLSELRAALLEPGRDPTAT